jgi:hypothetical protein
MKHKCICGVEFEAKSELRQHIALLTPRWPARRCSLEHYDPASSNDVDYNSGYYGREHGKEKA